MLKLLSNLVLGAQTEREMKRLRAVVDKVSSLEPKMMSLKDDDLRAKTAEFKERLGNGESLDSILPEAFAVVREVSRRILGMRHFDVQIMGGVVLHEGNIAEMKTGEGKTLVATLPVYLNALTGEGVHVVTVNDYLASRDAQWMGPIYTFLGLTCGVVVHGMSTVERKAAYACDITYGTNNQFGFDYLRDNMAIYASDIVQRGLNYAIVDEVDSILIDEARTPLIISGPSGKPKDIYYKFAHIVRQLRPEIDYVVDEKAHSVAPTEEGIARVEKMLGVKNLYEDDSMELSHYLNQALRAHALMRRDRDYVVKDGKVIIVDEFTGRLMFGRRYSDGLHQAIEAKEGVRIEEESQTLATITFQNYFRMYKKLAGMTGTAATEAEEFRKIYGLDVVVISTNEPMIRVDYPDVVYSTERAKFKAVVEEIASCYERGQPVLVGTVSIEKSEKLSEMLKRRGIPHQVLNAKYHEKEAQIIAKAGQRGAVTIATNMAGRGTDIVLGEGVKDLGGLHVIGTERHEARRIDDQLRGRSGRQGDPGSSRFYLSLEDDLMRLFGSDLISGIFERLKIDENQPLEHPMLSRAIERAQKRVEARNFDIRRRVLEYDDVMNRQREIIYAQRRKVLFGENLRDNILEMVKKVASSLVEAYAPQRVHREDWDLEGLATALGRTFLLRGGLSVEELKELSYEDLVRRATEVAVKAYEAKEASIGPELMRELERR
ncbi:MAG TPA: preprotein translocase subunit SecA, partial [Clostridia bacterium]|nr:preprotein translocase subunit SecA [Clostridia bacterium]